MQYHKTNQNMKLNFLRTSVFLLASLMLFSACESDNDKARIEVWLTDAPGDFQEVNVDIQDVQIHTGDDNGEGGWQSLSVNAGVYNLLELTNGLDTLLGDIEVPRGKISQVRLVLGDDNTVKIGDQVYSLSTPSAQQSGLKLQVNETLVEGITYKILLDFDVARSVLQTGAGQYKLKPVIRTITEAQDGAIKGVVDPIEATPAIYAIQNLDTVGTSFADSTGHFLIRGLKAGSYQVVFVPNSLYQTTVRENVSVELGAVTNVGTVTIQQ